MSTYARLRHSLLIVEGAHDAAFFGLLLKQRDFRQSEYRRDVPGEWWKLFPTIYPFSKNERLYRVVRCPDIFYDERGRCVGLIAADGDDALVKELRDAIDVLPRGFLDGIGIAIDADCKTPSERLMPICDKLRKLNQDNPDWSPLPVPEAVGQVIGERPKLAVHVFPDNQDTGRLETVLIDCAKRSHPAVASAADTMLADLLAVTPALDNRSVGKIRGSTAAREKAYAGVIANVVTPGVSLAVSIRDGMWLGDAALSTECVLKAGAFLDGVLPTV